jgi:DNA-binding ferritin-like protein (Dps family)
MLGRRFGRFAALLALLALVMPAVMAAGNESVYGEKLRETAEVFKKVREWHRFGIVLNNDTLDEARNLGIAMVEFGIASLESIKDRLEDSNLSMKDEIIDEINEHITDLVNAKEEIEDADTVEELKEAMRNAREVWIDAKVSLQKSIIIAVLDRLETFVENGEKLEEFVGEKIAEFQQEGKDTTMLENWLEDFREDRENALERIGEAKEKVMEIETPYQGFEAMKEVREAVKNAVEHTKECVKDLKEIIRLINQYGDVEDTEELMEVVEEVVEE